MVTGGGVLGRGGGVAVAAETVDSSEFSPKLCLSFCAFMAVVAVCAGGNLGVAAKLVHGGGRGM